MSIRICSDLCCYMNDTRDLRNPQGENSTGTAASSYAHLLVQSRKQLQQMSINLSTPFMNHRSQLSVIPNPAEQHQTLFLCCLCSFFEQMTLFQNPLWHFSDVPEDNLTGSECHLLYQHSKMCTYGVTFVSLCVQICD